MKLISKSSFILVNYIKIFFSKKGNGGNHVVLIHGWGKSHNFWSDYIDFLMENKFEVCIDYSSRYKTFKVIPYSSSGIYSFNPIKYLEFKNTIFNGKVNFSYARAQIIIKSM